jgi:hypothetical protein
MICHYWFVRILSEKKQSFVRTFPPCSAYSSAMTRRRTQEPEHPVHASTPSTVLAPLTPPWAFVVQLRQGTALSPEAIQGRVEHIVSGQASLFSSLEEARAFMERVLTQLQEKPP